LHSSKNIPGKIRGYFIFAAGLKILKKIFIPADLYLFS